MLSFGCMVERQSEPLKGEPAAKRGVGSTRLQSCEASHRMCPAAFSGTDMFAAVFVLKTTIHGET